MRFDIEKRYDVLYKDAEKRQEKLERMVKRQKETENEQLSRQFKPNMSKSKKSNKKLERKHYFKHTNSKGKEFEYPLGFDKMVSRLNSKRMREKQDELEMEHIQRKRHMIWVRNLHIPHPSAVFSHFITK